MIKAEDLVLPSVARLAPYTPGKPIEEVQRELGISEAVKLASNENPIGPSPLAQEAIRRALFEINRYPEGGSLELRRRIAARHRVDIDQVFIGSGSCEVINLLAWLFLRPGLNALMTEHSFAIYPLATAASGGESRAIPLADDYVPDLGRMAEAIDDSTRIVFLANPGNPTGTIYRRGPWLRFLERVPDGVLIVADEAYFEFVHDPEYPDSLEAHDGRRPIVTLRTFSKIFGLAGLRVGYAISRTDVITMLNHVRQPFNVTSLGQVAALAAMEDTDHVRTTLEVNAHGMKYLEAEFSRLGLRFLPSQANFILVEVGDGRGVCEGLLRRGVIVRPMDGYGLPRHVRISVGLPEENRRLIEALAAVI